MKIDAKIVSIPPYLSTTWEYITSLKMKGSTLLISLMDDSHVEIPDLDNSTVESIFQAHINYTQKLDAESSILSTQGEQTSRNNPFSQLSSLLNGDNNTIGFPIRFGPGGLEGLGAAMQHNPSQKDMPSLPVEILEKVGAIAKVLGSDENVTLPKPEPHCNCMHCQIASAIQQSINNQTKEEEEVSDEDLKFREWDITQTDDKLYTVTNPLNEQEQYSVYLGSPIGCTCGKHNCEHIKAVLNS